MNEPDDKLLEKLISKSALTKREKAKLRGTLPLSKLQELIESLSDDKENRATVKQLYKIQNALYPRRKKPKKPFRVQPTVGGKIVDRVFRGGLPSLGKRR